MWPGFDSGPSNVLQEVIPRVLWISSFTKTQNFSCFVVFWWSNCARLNTLRLNIIITITEFRANYFNLSKLRFQNPQFNTWNISYIASYFNLITTVSSILFRAQVPFPLRHVLLASSTILVKSIWDKFFVIDRPWHCCSLSFPPIMHWSLQRSIDGSWLK